jgi:ribosomal protein S18 acetylase RimI-like enzyme
MKPRRGKKCTVPETELPVDLSTWTENDIAGMQAIDATNYPSEVSWDRKYFKYMIEEDTIYFGKEAKLDGDLVGFIIWVDDWKGTIDISSLQVDPDHQGKGVGTCLLEDVLNSFGRKRVTAYVDAKNKKAMSLFENHGFVPLKIGERKKRMLGIGAKDETCNSSNMEECTLKSYYGKGRNAIRMVRKS